MGKNFRPPLLQELGAGKQHPLYGSWIKMYHESTGQCEWLIWLLDELTQNSSQAELALVEKHFVVSSKLEYMFWDMAYRKTDFPL